MANDMKLRVLMIPLIPIVLGGVLPVAKNVACAAEDSFEGELGPFLGEARFDMQQVFAGDRFPNVVVATDGTVLAFWNGVKVRRSEDGGKTWGEEILVGKGHMGGGVTVNEANGEVFAFVGQRHPPTNETVYRSQDHGKTWHAIDVQIKPDSEGHKPELHMNEHGITLRHGEHKGRLLRPTRYYGKQNNRNEWPDHYTNAIFSDDGGKTWPVERLVFEGGFAYSSLTAGRPNTPSEGWIYLQFEGGPQGGATVARFNLIWLLEGEKTGNGDVPDWLAQSKS